MQLGLGPTRVHPDMQDYCAVLGYTSDFSAGTDNFADASGANVTFTLTGNTDSIGGQDDTLKVVVNRPDPSAVIVPHNPIRGTDSEIQDATVGCRYHVSFRVFFPTGNTMNALASCRLNGGELVDMGITGKTLNTWHTISAFNVVAGNTSGDGLEIGLGGTGLTNSDEIYFKTIRVVSA